MGRSISGGISTSTSGAPWAGKFDKRPVWGVWSCNAASAASYVYLYGEDNPHIAIGAIDIASDNNANVGANQSLRQGASSESANTGWYPAGNTGTQLSTQPWSPSSSWFGVTCNSQTSNFFYAYGFQNGSFGYEGTQSTQSNIQQYAATQVMSQWEQQIYDIVLNSSNAIQVYPIGATNWSEVDWSYTRGVVTSILDVTRHQSTYGLMSYNRRTNTIAFLYNTADATTNTKKMHIFKMLAGFTVTPFTTGKQIADALAASKLAGGYSFFDISLPSWHNGTSNASRHGGRFVICDDDTAWFVSEQQSNSSSGSNLLYKIVKNGTGGYTATQLRSMSTNSHYNSDNSSHYAIRHTNSDDNKYIAIYAHYYYYLSGINLFIVPTDSAASPVVSSSYYQDAATSAGSRTIAPMGGSNFVICNSSYNHDSYGAYISYIRPEDKSAGENGLLVLRHAGQLAYPGYSTSTNYQANFVFKVMPVTESK